MRAGPEVALPAVAAEAIDLDAMALVLEVELVGDDGKHALEAIVLEFLHRSAPHADQVLMLLGRRHRLVAAEALAEVVGADEPALDQGVQGAIDRGGADRRAQLLEPALDGLDREMLIGLEEDPRDQRALRRDRKAVIAEVTVEALEEAAPPPHD